MSKNLNHELKRELYNQFRLGKYLAKIGKGHTYQKQKGRVATHNAIWSQGSFRALKSSAKRVAIFAKKQGYKSVSDLQNTENLKQIFSAETSAGLSAGTQSQDLRLINHVLIGKKLASTQLRKEDVGIARRSNLIAEQRYKSLTSKEWENTHKIAYKHHRAQIEFIRDTGLRRSELSAFKLYKVNDTYEVLTIGKNGKSRFAEVRPGTESAVLEVLGKPQVPSISTQESQKILKNPAYIKSQIQVHGQKIKLSDKIPSHIHRAYYAQQLIQQLANRDYSSTSYTTRSGVVHGGNEMYQIGEYKAPYGAFMELSEDMGHNRLEVLKNYLGTGR